MKTIPLTKGYETIVDDDMYDYLNQWKWYYHKGFAIRRIVNKEIRMNRIVSGALWKVAIIHINGDKLDNRKENLTTLDVGNTRRCCGCKIYKDVSLFNKSSTLKDRGYERRCKECHIIKGHKQRNKDGSWERVKKQNAD